MPSARSRLVPAEIFNQGAGRSVMVERSRIRRIEFGENFPGENVEHLLVAEEISLADGEMDRQRLKPRLRQRR